jgi:hypothetical protein
MTRGRWRGDGAEGSREVNSLRSPAPTPMA